MHQTIPLPAWIRAHRSPIRQRAATGDKSFATATRTELLSTCWMIDYHSNLFSGSLRIRIARSWSPTGRMDQNSPVRIQADDIIAGGHITFRSLSLIHISFFHTDENARTSGFIPSRIYFLAER